MNAAEIAAALGDERRDGRDWKCRCPCCNGRLSLRDGDHGRPVWHCWGTCNWRDVARELRRLGYLSGEQPAPLPPEEIKRRKAAEERKRRADIANARDLWDQARPIKDTLGDHYLRVVRGLDVLSPYIREAETRALRYLPRAWHSPGIYRPAIAAAIEHVEHGFIGCHITYLAVGGSGKTTLDPPRKVFGGCKGGAVRLGTPRPGEWLAIAEGLESTLSVAVACAMPAWAALSAGGIRSLVLPSEFNAVLICADNDANGIGQAAARDAAARFIAERRRCCIAIPRGAKDFNDVLTGRAAAAIEEARHVAA